jgi:predicted secreted protein
MKIKNRILASALFSVLILPLSITSAQAASVVKITESGNGKSFSVKAGSEVQITLHSTFWSLKSISNLVGSQTPVMTAIMPGPTAPANCQLPGMGCGTVVWKFKASKTGKASFVAIRTSCGEALRCTAKTGRFSVLFKVS